MLEVHVDSVLARPTLHRLGSTHTDHFSDRGQLGVQHPRDVLAFSYPYALFSECFPTTARPIAIDIVVGRCATLACVSDSQLSAVECASPWRGAEQASTGCARHLPSRQSWELPVRLDAGLRAAC